MYCPLHLSLFAGCRYWLTVFSRRDIPDPDEDIYDAVYQDDDEDIYDDLCALKNKRLNDREQVLPLEHWSSSFFFLADGSTYEMPTFCFSSGLDHLRLCSVCCVMLCCVVLWQRGVHLDEFYFGGWTATFCCINLHFQFSSIFINCNAIFFVPPEEASLCVIIGSKSFRDQQCCSILQWYCMH